MSKRRVVVGGKKGAAPQKVGDHIFVGLAVHEPNAAGIDIGSEEHYVSVPEDRDPHPVRKFGCTTPDLRAMADWLEKCGIRSVVMESTGVYWVPVHQVLEEAGLDVNLVDARHARNVPGRKTDVWDCTWLRKLHTYGLLRSCFIPPAQIRELRTYWRHRATLVDNCSQQVMRMQKALEQMNLQLHKVLSDITGMTGMKIIRAILAGEQDPKVLATMRHVQVRASEEAIVKALTGFYREDQLFALRQTVATYDFLHAQIRECDQQIQAVLSQFQDSDPHGPKTDGPVPKEDHRISRRKNQPHFDMRSELKRILGVDLTRIDGISDQTAMMVLTECGTDLSRFPDEDHFSSWLHTCPNNRITGGKVRSRRTQPGKNRLATALCLAAQSLHNSKSALGAYFRRMKARLGAPKAITATAHKLAKLIYLMLTRGEEYVDNGQEQYEQQYKEQRLKALKRQARSLGFNLLDMGTGELVS